MKINLKLSFTKIQGFVEMANGDIKNMLDTNDWSVGIIYFLIPKEFKLSFRNTEIAIYCHVWTLSQSWLYVVVFANRSSCTDAK